MSPIPSIGLGEVLFLAGCAGLVLLIGVVVVAVIVKKRKKSDAPANDSGTSGNDEDEKATTTKTRLRYALLVIIFLIAFGIFLVLDLLFQVSVYLRFVTAYAAFWTLVGALLLHGNPLRRQVLILALFAVAVFSIHLINWNSRKPFLKDLYRVEQGMTEAQVEQIMGKYIMGTGWPASPVSEMTKPEELVPPNSVVYRHTNEGWGDSDWGVVTFEDNRVAQVDFLMTPKSTPPGADLAGGKLEQTGYVFLGWKEGLRIMIWHDIPESYIGGGSGSTRDPVYRYHGYAESSEGRRFEVDVRTLDGKTAQFKIGDTIYDLSNGTLFLVTTIGGKTEVKQLQRDLSDVELNHESIVAFAQSDPDVARFAGVTSDSQ